MNKFDMLAANEAVKLYELGRLSSGRAADLAGMSRCEFLTALGRYRHWHGVCFS